MFIDDLTVVIHINNYEKGIEVVQEIVNNIHFF